MKIEKERQEFLQEVTWRNRNVMRQLHRRGLLFEYDPEIDILTATFGRRRPAITQSVDQNLELRLDPETLMLCGFEVLDFAKYVKSRRYFLSPRLTEALLEYGVLHFPGKSPAVGKVCKELLEFFSFFR